MSEIKPPPEQQECVKAVDVDRLCQLVDQAMCAITSP